MMTLQPPSITRQPPSITLQPPSVTRQPPSVTRQPPSVTPHVIQLKQKSCPLKNDLPKSPEGAAGHFRQVSCQMVLERHIHPLLRGPFRSPRSLLWMDPLPQALTCLRTPFGQILGSSLTDPTPPIPAQPCVPRSPRPAEAGSPLGVASTSSGLALTRVALAAKEDSEGSLERAQQKTEQTYCHSNSTSRFCKGGGLEGAHQQMTLHSSLQTAL